MSDSIFKKLARDLKVSFTFTYRNTISFFLAMIGVSLVTLILIIMVVLLVVIPILFSGGIGFLIWLVITLVSDVSVMTGFALLVVLMLLLLPLLAPVIIGIGALYGMSREIVESEGTTAEGVFTWYRKKFLSFIGTGLLLFVIVAGPLLPIIYFIPYFIQHPPDQTQLTLIFFIMSLWLMMSSGFLSLTIPGVIDDLSILKAARHSIRLSWRYFDRVFGIWLIYIAIILLPLAPAFLQILDIIQLPPNVDLEPIIGSIVILLSIFVIPSLAIAQTRIYMILSAEYEESFIPVDESQGGV